MATSEQQMKKLTEEFSKIKKNYGGLNRDLMLCQEEILLLKRSNAEIREEMELRIAENEELKALVGADGVRDELAQVKGDLKELSRKLKSLEKLTCRRRDVTTLEGKVQQTTDSVGGFGYLILSVTELLFFVLLSVVGWFLIMFLFPDTLYHENGAKTG